MNTNNYKIKIKGTLGLFNILIMMLLIIILLFILSVGFFHSQDGGVKEIVTDWDNPQATINAYDILIFPLIVGIYFSFTIRKRKIVDAEINVNKENITIKYKNNIFTIDVTKIKKIKINKNLEINSVLLSFEGNKDMVVTKDNKILDKYEVLLIDNYEKLCKDIITETSKEIIGFN